MKNLIITLVVIVIVLVGAYYFAFYPSNTPTTTTENPPVTTTQSQPTQTTIFSSTTTVTTTPIPAATSSAPAVQSVTIHIKNFAFSPATITVAPGTKVTWINDDSAPHTVTSDSGSLLKSATLKTGQSFSFTFTTVGMVPYHCSIHPTMKAQIVVKNS